MKKVLPVIIVLMFSFCGKAQEKNILLGKWKLITFDAGVFHDFRNDSTYYPPEFLKSLKDNNDSTIMFGFFDALIKNCENYYYVFNDNNNFQEINKGKIKEGVYKVSSEKEELVLMSKNKLGEETIQTLLYELDRNILLIKLSSDDMDIKMQFVKSEQQ